VLLCAAVIVSHSKGLHEPLSISNPAMLSGGAGRFEMVVYDGTCFVAPVVGRGDFASRRYFSTDLSSD
jgi:hypothetical protein